MSDTATDTFFKHLESCKSCANNPFNLCLIGQIWIQKAVSEAGEGMHNFLQSAIAKCGKI